jgi:hypothetical protein
MRDHNQAIQQIIPPPVTTDKDAADDPSMLPVFGDGSIDSSLYSWDSESEGGIWDNQYNDDVSIAPKGSQLIPPDDDGNRAPLVGLPVGCNIDPEREAAHPAPNIVPAPIIAPDGAICWRREKTKQYPPAVLQHGADSKLERITMSIVQKEYKKFNRDVFALTFGHHDIPPMAQQMSKKW